MSGLRERSGIFKFFYVILSVITFPIFAILFILRHPLWLFVILLVLAGGAAYFPISQGVKPDNIVSWYQQKYADIKVQIVSKAANSGSAGYLPQSVLDDVKKIEADAKEEQMPKSENYNAKVVRDEVSSETKLVLKKRNGFKKKEAVLPVEKSAGADTDAAAETEALDTKEGLGGGLSFLLKQHQEESVVEEPVSVEEKAAETDDDNDADLRLFDDETETEVSVELKKTQTDEKPVIPQPEETTPTSKTNDDDLELDLF